VGLFDALRMMMGGSKHPADTPPPTGVITPAGPSPAAPSSPSKISAQPGTPDLSAPAVPTNPTTTVPVAEPPVNNTVAANDDTDMPSITPESTGTTAPDTGAAIVSPGDTPSAMPETTPTSSMPDMSGETPATPDGSQGQKPGNPLPPQA